MSNPWEKIDLELYEKHMSLGSIYQLQTMNEMMRGQYYTYPVKTAMILGIAGGNGLEHIDVDIFEKVYGVDVNKDYLIECQKRYQYLKGIFETICVDLTSNSITLPNVELLIANLLIEYIGYKAFQRIIKVVKPKYVSCIIQINIDKEYVSDSPYIHIFDGLDEVHHQMSETELEAIMDNIGYKKILCDEELLPNGKKLVRIDFLSFDKKVGNFNKKGI